MNQKDIMKSLIYLKLKNENKELKKELKATKLRIELFRGFVKIKAFELYDISRDKNEEDLK